MQYFSGLSINHVYALEALCPSCQHAHARDDIPRPFKEKGIESRKAQMSQAVTPKTVGLVFCHCVRVGVEGVFWII